MMKTFSCQIYKNDSEILFPKIKNKQRNVDFTMLGFNLSIQPAIEIEMDGLIIIKGFDIAQFDKEEINIIYNGIKDINCNLAAIEIKLNKKRAKDIILQIKRDDDVLNRLTKKNNTHWNY